MAPLITATKKKKIVNPFFDSQTIEALTLEECKIGSTYTFKNLLMNSRNFLK